MNREKARNVVSGALLYGGVLSLYQDLRFGTADVYASYIVGGGWTDRTISIPIAIVFIGVAILLLRGRGS